MKDINVREIASKIDAQPTEADTIALANLISKTFKSDESLRNLEDSQKAGVIASIILNEESKRMFNLVVQLVEDVIKELKD